MSSYGTVDPAPVVGTCAICDTENVELVRTVVALEYLESWKTTKECDHSFCRECLRTWFTPKARAGVRQLACPDPSCSAAVWAHDLHRMDQQLFPLYKHSVGQECKGRLDTLDPDLQEYMAENALRNCPRCFAIVERWVPCLRIVLVAPGSARNPHVPGLLPRASRSEGCNYMVCICATAFCYECGSEYNSPDQPCSCG